MEDITSVSKAIRLFQWMAKDRFTRFQVQPATLRDDSPMEPLLLDGDPKDEYSRTDVQTLSELGFLRRDRSGYYELTDKAERLVEAMRARGDEITGLAGPLCDWVIVSHRGLFIDEGTTPPNLRALMGDEWELGDRIVITCHNPEYLLVSHLPLALAGDDPLFESDLREVTADFK